MPIIQKTVVKVKSVPKVYEYLRAVSAKNVYAVIPFSFTAVQIYQGENTAIQRIDPETGEIAGGDLPPNIITGNDSVGLPLDYVQPTTEGGELQVLYHDPLTVTEGTVETDPDHYETTTNVTGPLDDIDLDDIDLPGLGPIDRDTFNTIVIGIVVIVVAVIALVVVIRMRRPKTEF